MGTCHRAVLAAALLIPLAAETAPPPAGTPAGAPKPPPPTEAAMRQWIEDLGSDSFAKREAASRKLEEADEAALPLLEQVKSDDPEVRQRVRALLEGAATFNHSNAGATLKLLVTHEGIWRSQDVDRNGRADYWTRDIAAFYAAHDASGNTVRLIDKALAQADAAPARAYPELGDKPVPKDGYFFKALKKDQNGKPYVDPASAPATAANLAPGPSTHASRIAFCAYPARYGKHGKLTFFVCEDGVVWQKDLGRDAKGLEASPYGDNGAPPSQSGWTQFGG